MSYDYTLTIKRKNDGKIIGKAFCNEIKNLISTKFIEKLNGSIYGMGKMSFTTNEAYMVLDNIEETIKKEYSNIFERKLLSASASNVEIKRNFEEEIMEAKEYIEELMCMYASLSKIIGKINTLCEDMLHFNPEKNDWEYDPENNPVTYEWDIIAEIE